MTLPPETSLAEAKSWLRERVNDGERCPCCNQMAKVYRRRIHTGMARTLIKMHAARGHERAVHTPSLDGDTHEASQLAWWGLIEEAAGRREDGGKAGWWRITRKGHMFVCGDTTVPKWVHVYDGQVVGQSGGPVSLSDCLGEPFSYQDTREPGTLFDAPDNDNSSMWEAA